MKHLPKLIALIFVNFILVANAHAYRYDFFLKGGVNQAYAKIKGNEGSNDLLRGTGFNTHFGHKWKYFDIAFSSNIYWGEIEDISFNAGNENIRGEGSIRHVSFGPILRYQFRGVEIYKDWFLFAGLGPVWSIQTIKMESFNSSGPNFNRNQKLVYESTGGVFVIGFEEDLPYKEMHQVYVELSYSYKKSKELSIVDASDFVETNILSTQEAQQDLSGHYYMISIGFTVF